MAKIANVLARQILDSRGTPTIEVTVVLDSGVFAIGSCPSGASTGKHEALELRDNDPKNFNGKSVLKAVETINTIIKGALVGKEADNINTLDQILLELDNSEAKSNFGANSLLATSITLTKAIAFSMGLPVYRYIAQASGLSNLTLPKPLSNLLNGGMHAGWNLDIQEFLVIPNNSSSFFEGLQRVVQVYSSLKILLLDRGFQPLVGDEGGFAPKLTSNEEALLLLQEAIKKAGFDDPEIMRLGIDAASSNFYKEGSYVLKDKPDPFSPADLGAYYDSLAQKYNLLYAEDLFAEDAFDEWTTFLPTAPEVLIVTGDDLTVTNPKRLEEALAKKAIRGIIIKPNQIGTVSEAITVVSMAKTAGITVVVSHRSGETTDDFIADFAVGVNADLAKFGAPARGERVVKYNRLLQIEQELNAKRLS